MKNLKVISLIVFCILLLSNCEKEDHLQFGTTETDLKVDSSYWASTDGLLFIETSSNQIGVEVGYVYSDSDIDSTTLIGTLYSNDNATYPIMKGNYWRVTKKSFSDPYIKVNMNIRWTPMN